MGGKMVEEDNSSTITGGAPSPTGSRKGSLSSSISTAPLEEDMIIGDLPEQKKKGIMKGLADLYLGRPAQKTNVPKGYYSHSR